MTTATPRIANITTEPDEPIDMPGASGVRMVMLIGREHGAPNFSMRRFTIEPGGHSPKHSHDYEHEVVILDGKGTALLAGEERAIHAGDVLFVPPDEEHQFRAAADEPLRFICLVPASRNCGDPTPGS